MEGADREPIPVTRRDTLIVTEAADELLVYDESAHQLHHLNTQSRQGWLACDGRRTISAISMETGLNAETVRLAVDQLAAVGLLGGAPTNQQPATSRRRLLKRSAVAIPAIVSLTVPFAAAHASSVCEVIPGPQCFMLISFDTEWCWAPAAWLETPDLCTEGNRYCNHDGLCTAWCELSTTCVGQDGPGDPD